MAAGRLGPSGSRLSTSGAPVAWFRCGKERETHERKIEEKREREAEREKRKNNILTGKIF